MYPVLVANHTVPDSWWTHTSGASRAFLITATELWANVSPFAESCEQHSPWTGSRSRNC